MKKNNTAEKALIDAEKISKALKESTEKTLRGIVAEAISDMIEKDDDAEKEDEEPIEDDSFEVEDVETKEEPKEDEKPEDGAGEAEEGGEDDKVEEEPEEDNAENEWSDMEDFKVGDNDYDFTGVDGETALKVYNKLGDDDQILVQKQDDGTFEMKDDETGAEYVIELEPEEEEEADADDADDTEKEPEDDEKLEIELEDEPEDDKVEEPEDDKLEIELEDEPEEEEKEDELNEEDELGYTDSYQKDVMPGLKMGKKPVEGTYEEDEVPQGTEKPWAGEGEGKPFEEKLNEGDSIATQAARKMVKTKHGQHRPENGEEVKKVDSPLTAESVKKIVNKAKAIQAENKQYKDAIDGIKKALKEAAILNINYGKVVSLLVNETATKEEKLKIVERFNNVKTINEGTELYNTIKHELNETKKSAPIVERVISANSSKNINETTIYTPKNNPSINLMERMDNLFKK